MLICIYIYKILLYKINYSIILFIVQWIGNEILVYESIVQYNNYVDVEIMKGIMGNFVICI